MSLDGLGIVKLVAVQITSQVDALPTWELQPQIGHFQDL